MPNTTRNISAAWSFQHKCG